MCDKKGEMRYKGKGCGRKGEGCGRKRGHVTRRETYIKLLTFWVFAKKRGDDPTVECSTYYSMLAGS